ncbi:MAG: D-alanyl-D-alanine carboxypeptidase family protein, partial [Candidatus Faecousia sp.]|nr:D-alanyl-D-alanine carboxypeptidase family protein [Candidatus Faecousia sp.]
MSKRLISACLIALVMLSCLPVGAAAADLEIAAPSAILMDAATGTVLYEKNADELLPPASVTKIMTLLLVMEALDSGKIGWDDMVVTSDAAAAKGGSQVYLEPGEQMSMDEMLKSVVVSSANDCATALAEHVAGSESAFVSMMNQRAAELGMTNTHFVNCTGLDDGEDAAEHLTTARDIAIMSQALLRHDAIRKYTTIWMDTVRNGQFGLSNTNKLVRFYEGTTGLKTGFTQGAGHCLSASAQRNGIELIAVVLHCASSTDRFESAKALLDYGFANYALVTPDLDVELTPIPVKLGVEETVTPVLADDTPVLIDKGKQAGVTRTVELAEELEAPVEQGQQVG